MSVTLPGKLHYIDGFDLWLTFGIFISKGSAELLKYPPKKQSITHDWQDSNGIDVDLSRMFLDQRKFTISFCIIAPDEISYRKKHDAFLGLLLKPGLHRLELTSHPGKSYFIYYEECNSYEDATKLLGVNASRQIAMKFNVVFVEPEPDHNYVNTYIIDETGKFLIA